MTNSWTECTTIGVPTDNSKQPNAIFVNSYSGSGPSSGSWHEIDISDKIPEDTKAVFLSGVLIITHGTTSEIANLTIGFRAPGSSFDPNGQNYIGQCIEANTTGGQRSTFATWVPVIDGKFEFRWDRPTTANYPIYSAYGVNLSLQAYVK